MKFRLPATLFVSVLAATATFADARIDQWINKARSAVGPESALEAVQSIHFSGTFTTTEKVPVNGDPKNTKDENVVLAIDIVFQKPYQQRIIRRSNQVVETTALDGYDAWVRRSDANDASKWQLSLLDSQQVKRLRANTWENLFFYRGIEKRGGKVELGGDVAIDGKDCVKLTFTHAENIIFIRYFEKATGRLVRTETESGGEIREEGEIRAGGLRFPRTLFNKAPNGQIATITFDSVKINETFPADTFAVPTLMAQ
jgi:outer membrane lipoprotein-sorting protein